MAAAPSLDYRAELISRIDIQSVVTQAASDPVVPAFSVAGAQARIAPRRAPDRITASTAVDFIPTLHPFEGVGSGFAKKDIGALTAADSVGIGCTVHFVVPIAAMHGVGAGTTEYQVVPAAS